MEQSQCHQIHFFSFIYFNIIYMCLIFPVLRYHLPSERYFFYVLTFFAALLYVQPSPVVH